ncbi:MAG: helix-turn-helix transcriptional regulator [Ruminococcaceae bacterium]|nr:helix-turn-helix transcriptional regulator [Oscillospiraceae bacterium]
MFNTNTYCKSARPIISTSVPITEVAISCGYSNLSYFISEYKKIHGKSPLKMRKQFSVR